MARTMATVALAITLVLGAVACTGDGDEWGDAGAALLEAAADGDAAQVDELLALDVDLEVRDEAGKTPLILATNKNHVEVARALIAAGADVNAVDGIGDSAYLYAGAEGHLEILALTLANGADLKATNRFGGTALIPAAEKGHPHAVRMLIAAGVAVDHVNKLGWTALQEAVVLGDGGAVHLDIVDQLLAAGADPNLVDRDGHTPLRNAEERNHAEIAARIRAGGGHL